MIFAAMAIVPKRDRWARAWQYVWNRAFSVTPPSDEEQQHEEVQALERYRNGLLHEMAMAELRALLPREMVPRHAHRGPQ